jgi:hypothetical protein
VLNAQLHRWLFSFEKTRHARPGEAIEAPSPEAVRAAAVEADSDAVHRKAIWHYTGE